MNYEHFSTKNLLREWEALEKCQSRGVSDEIRINLIEKELDYRGISDYDLWLKHYSTEESA
jgi:hypothetical protein